MAEKKLMFSVKNMDCIKGMKAMEAGSVDMVFADPPFNIGFEYDEYHDGREEWDYLKWSAEWIQQVYRVLKRHGTFWLAIGDEYAAQLRMLATNHPLLRCEDLREWPFDPKFKGFHLRSWVLWYYTFGVATTKNFARSHTHLFYFTKTKSRFTFNADDGGVRVPSARQLVYNDARANPKGKLPDNTWILAPADLQLAFTHPQGVHGQWLDTWLASRICGTFGERIKGAPNQMPQTVMERIVLATSKPGDLVLDPFVGTGSTGEAALRSKRSFVGFEISKEYSRRARERLRQVVGG